MKHSESLIAFAGAMAKAQAAMKGAKKDANNPAFNSKYADLSSVVSEIRAAFSGNGLSYMQFPVQSEGEMCGVETMLLHESGEWVLSDPCFVPVSKANAHGYGSALTYSRRYGLVSACGLETADDDGNDAVKAVPKAEEPDPKWETAIAACTSMDALRAAWKAMPAGQRTACATSFALKKSMLSDPVPA